MRRPAIGIEAARGTRDGIPSSVVPDNEQDGELHAPGHTGYLYAVGTLLIAAAVAAAALGRRRTLPAPAARAIDGLRGLHNGRPGDYVAWAAAGLAVLGGLFAVLLQ